MKKLRVVHVGCGGISNAWFGALKNRADVEVVGLVDLDIAAAGKCAAKHGLTSVETGTDLEAMLRKTKPDAVFDCTVPEAHVAVTTLALKHGCHVLGEKPLAESMPNARRMVAAAKEAGRTYAVMQNRRYMTNIQALRRFLDTQAIGRVTTVYSDFFIGAHFGGFRDKMPHVLLLDMAIHTFDAARYLTGAAAKTALAHEWNPPGSWYEHHASAVALFEMTDDIVYSYRGSWCAEGLDTPWEATWRIIGEKGTVTWDGKAGFHAQSVTSQVGFTRERKDVAVPYDAAAAIIEGHAGCIDEFVNCVRAGKTPQTSCTDNINSLAMVHGAIASAAAGRQVSCACSEEGSAERRSFGGAILR